MSYQEPQGLQDHPTDLEASEVKGDIEHGARSQKKDAQDFDRALVARFQQLFLKYDDETAREKMLLEIVFWTEEMHGLISNYPMPLHNSNSIHSRSIGNATTSSSLHFSILIMASIQSIQIFPRKGFCPANPECVYLSSWKRRIVRVCIAGYVGMCK